MMWDGARFSGERNRGGAPGDRRKPVIADECFATPCSSARNDGAAITAVERGGALRSSVLR